MFKGLSHKTKVYLLIGGLTAFAYVLVNFFITDTVEVWAEKSRLQDSLSLLSSAQSDMQMLKQKLSVMEKKAGLNKKLDSLSHQQYLLEIITHYANEHRCIVRNIPSINTAQNNGFNVETLVFGIEGAYKDLVQLVYLLEQKYQVGKLSSVSFNIQTDLRTGKRSLEVSIYIQKISKK